jgi:hypothetical protein
VGWHTPPVHAPPWHECPHEPQLAASLFVLAQVLLEEQNVGVVAGHTHALPAHADLGAEHAVLQLPQ